MLDDWMTKLVNVAAAIAAIGIIGTALAQKHEACAPGKPSSCTCIDGINVGAQKCNADGSGWTACTGCPAVVLVAPAVANEPVSAPVPPDATPACSYKMGTLAVSNRKVPIDGVATALTKSSAALDRCCEEAAKGGSPSAPRQMQLRLAIGKDGKVAKVAAAPGHSPAPPPCVLSALREADFAEVCKPPSGPARCVQPTMVTVPLSFETK
ncbi:MAG TPA: hypothetical protein VJT73_21165 [Polyangiaceae bacterium]|nr:hypothetical protein [Polyangiaceae bacterium]